MSAQSGKKKRIGSRRRVANQNKTSEADEFHVTDSTSVAQPFISEENSESLNVFDNSDNSQSETQKPPSPEFPVNRKKLGSSRRSKGGQHVKDSELHLKSREKVEEQTSGNETEKTIQPQRQEELSKGTESATHDSSLLANTPDYSSEIRNSTITNSPDVDLESFIPKSENLLADKGEISTDNKVVSDSFKLVETKHGGTDKTDTLQSEELLENAETFGISELTTASVTVKEGKEIDEGKESLKQDGNLQGNYVVCESHVKLEDIEFSITAEVTTDKSSPRENVGLEYSVGQAAFSSSNEKLQIDEEKNEGFKVSEVKFAQHSGDAVNEVHKQEANPTEMHEINHSSDRGTQGEHCEVISVYLTDKAEVSDTNQSRWMLGSADDSATKQEDSDPDDKQNEHPTKEEDFKALEQTNDDTKIPQISSIEEVNSALGQVYEVEGQVEDDIKHCAEQTVHQEKDGLISEMEESDSSSQTLQSELHAPFDSQPQQNDTDLHPLGSRRKLGSSRRHKGRQHAKDSVAESRHEEKDEVVESIRGKEALETTQMPVAIERTSQEEFSQGSENDIVMPTTLDSSLYADIMQDYSSEVQNLNTSIYPETDLKTLAPKSEKLQEDNYERESDFKVSDESVGDRLEEMDKLDTVQSQEVRAAQHSADAGNKVHEQEVNPTEMHEIDHSSENVTHDSTEKLEIISGNLTDKAEVSNTNQLELMLESTDDSAAKQEDSDPDDKQDEHPTKEDDFKALEQTRQDTKIPQISSIEEVNSALGQVYEVEGQVEDDIKHCAEQTVHQEKDGLISEMEESDSSSQTLQSELHAPFDSQPQQNDTDLHPLGSRRKLGSSRRHKGRQHAKDSVAESHHEEKDEVVESIRGKEALETTQMPVAIERTSQEEFSQGSENDLVMPTTHDSSLYADIMEDYSSEVQNLNTSIYPETDLKTLAPKSEKPQEDNYERESDFKVSDESVGDRLEEMDKLDTVQSQEVRAAQHSADAGNKVHEQEVNPTEMHEIDHSSENVTHDSTEKLEIISGNLTDKAEVSNTNQLELMLESTDDSATKQEDSDPDDKQDEHPTKEDDFKALEQTRQDTKIPQISSIEEVNSALGQVYEVEGQVEDDIKHCAEQTVHQEKDGLFSEMEESDSSSQTLQSELHAPFDSQPQRNDTDLHPLGSRRKLGSSRRHKGRQHAKDSVAESHHEEKDEVVESIRGKEALETTQMPVAIERTSQEEFSQGSENDIVMPTTHDSSLYADIMQDYSSEVQNVNTSIYPETDLKTLAPKSEKLQEDNYERESDFKVSDESVGDRLEEMDKLDTVQSQEVRAAQHSADAGNKVHEQEVNPTEMHEIDHSSENVTHDSTEKLEIISGNLIDGAEVSNTNQLELMLESTDDSATKQEDSDPDDKQDEHPTKEDDFKALEQTHQDTKIPQISSIEEVNSALGQVYEVEGQVEDDIKHCAEQTVHQEKEGLISEMEESDSSSQTLQSELHAPFDSQPQRNDTDLHPLGSRRKLGSSRRHKGRRHAKDSVAESHHEEKDEVVESIRGKEALETTQMPVAIERTSQEEFSQGSENDIVMPTTHDSSLYADIMQDYSSEVQNLNTSIYPETDLKTLAPKSEKLQEDNYERESDFKVSDESVGDRLEEMDKLDTVQSQEVRAAQHSADAGNKVHEQEVNPTEMHEIDHSSENVTHDSTEKLEIISGNLIDRSEVSNTNQLELMLESTDDSATKQEDSDPDDKQDEHPTKEDDFKALEQTHQDTKIPQISSIEEVNSALGQVYEVEGQVEDDLKHCAEQTVHQEKEVLFSEMEESDSSSQTLQSELHAPFDSQPQRNDTDLHPLGSRRKLGSSRRHKGRQHAKDSVAESHHEEKDEVVESIGGKEALETTQMPVAIERMSQEEFSQGSENDIVMPTTHDSSLYADIMQDYSSEVQNLNTSIYPETDLKTLAPKSEKLQEDNYERESDFKVSDESVGDRLEEMDKLDTVQSQEIRAAQHSADAGNKVHEQEVNPTEMHEIDHSSENVTHDSTEKLEIISGNLIDRSEVSNTNQLELMLESTDDSATKQEDSDPDDKQDEHPTKEDDFKALEQTHQDTKIPQISSIEEVNSALGQVYEVEGQVEDDLKHCAEQTVHQEKEVLFSEMEESDSSSQTLQSELHAPFDSQPQRNDTDLHPLGSRRKLGSSRRHKGRQHAKDSVAESHHEEKEVVESIRGKEALEPTQMPVAIERTSQEEFSQGSENDIVMPTTHDSSLYADIMQDYSSEVQNPNTSIYPETDLERLTPKSEKLQEDDNERESDFKVSDESSAGDRLEEMDKLDTVQSQEVRAAQHSEDVGNKVHEQEVNLTQMHEIDHSSESVKLDATEKSEIISDNLKDQAEDSDTNQSELILESTDDSATKQEDLNPDDKQFLHPAKEGSLEASEQTNEDAYVYDTKQIHIDDIERVDADLAQGYEIEGRVEDDIKPSTEQSVLQEKEGHSSEDEEDRSLQTLPSEACPPSDSQPQQSDTNFKPIGNRRKLGSSRRIKVREQAKDSVTKSYHRPTEEVVGHTRDNESIETTKVSFTTETAVQEKSVEAIQEGIDTRDTTQTEELKQFAHIGISQLTASSLLFSTAGQLLINQSNSMEMPEEIPNVYSITEKESKDGDEYTGLLRQDGNLQDNYLVRESHLKLEDIEYSITAGIAKANDSSREHIEPQYSVEQAIVSSRKEESSTHEETIEHFNLCEVKVAQHSDDAMHKVHEQEVKPTEMHEIAHYSDNVTHDATEKSEIISGNLIDKAKVSDTNQSESMVESTDDSATKQEDSDPDDKQNEHSTKEEDFKALEQTHQDTKIPQISGIEQVNNALGQVDEVEGQVGDDIIPSAEQTVHQEKEGLISEMEESDSSSQTLQSELHAPFDSQPQQNDTDLHPLGSRRKLGSSRRHKGRQHAKDSVAESHHEEKEVVESIRGKEALETTQMPVPIERTSQQEFSQGSENDIVMPTTHDSSLYADIMQDYSSEVQNLNTSIYPETDLKTLAPKSEKLQEDNYERESDFKVSDESVGDRLEEMDKLDILQSQEVRAAQHSEDAGNKVHEQEVNLTQMHEIDHSSESVTLSDNLIDQAEVSDTNQSELIVESTDDSATEQEDSNPDDKQGVHHVKEGNLESSEQINEDYNVYDKKQVHIADIERVDADLAQVYEIEGRVEDDIKPSTEQSVLQEKEGHSSEDEEDRSLQTLPSEAYPPSDSQPQQSDTNFKPIGNRRKLGSSRRIKVREQAKDSVAESYHRPTEEVVGHTGDNESIETTKMSFTTETAVQEKSVEAIQEGIDTRETTQTENINNQVKENAAVGIFELTASSLHSSATVDELLVDQTSSMEIPEEERPNLYSVTERKSKHKDNNPELLGQNENMENDLLRESHLKSEEADSSVTLEKDTEQHSLGEHTDIECSVEQAAFSSSKYIHEAQKEHVSLSQVRGSPQSEHAVNEVHEELVNLKQVREMHQIGFSSIEESESLQTRQSETNAPLDSQHQDNSLRREEQTHAGFKATGNRRKLGSSRRNKGGQQVEKSVAESYHEHKEDVVETRRSDGVLDPTKMSLAVETARQEEVQKQADLDLRSVPKIRKIRSTVKDEDSNEIMLEKETVLSQKIIHNSTNVTTNVASSSSKDDISNKDYNEEEKNVTKEPENLVPFTEHDTVKTDLIQSPEDDSDIQNISFHNDYVTTRPITVDVLEQEDMNMQQTNGATATVGDVTIKDYNTEAESSIDVHVFGERFEDPTKKDQETNASQEFTHAEPFAAAHNKTDTSAPSGHKENFRAEPATDVSEESRISTAVGVSDSQQGTQEKTQLDNSGNLQGKSNQKRRKLGSTRRTQFGRKPEEGMDDKDETKDRDDMRNLDEMEVVGELPMSVTAEVSKNENTKPSLSTANKEEQEAPETAAVPVKGQKLQSNNADLQSIQSNMISDIDYSKAILLEQLASNNEVVNPIKFAHAVDIRDSERNVDVNVEPSQLDDFTVSEMHVTSVSKQSDIERPESVNVIQDQALESAEASAVAVADLEIVKFVVRGEVGEEKKHAQASVQDLREVNEEAHNKNLEMRSTSPHRRRKMGSTRRNLGSRSKWEDLHENQDMDDEATATNVEDVKTERFQSIKEKEEPQLETEDKDSENVESHFRPPSEQTFEENPVSHGQAVETEHQLTPSYLPVMPSTSPKADVMSEAAGGRRRKMGSSRKSHGQQSNVNQTPGGGRVTDTQNGGDVASIIDEHVIKTAEEESFGLDKISEVDESAKKPSSNISTSKAGEHLKPVREKTPAHVTTVQHPYAEIRLSQESQQTLSLAGSSTGAASRSNRYNVLMVGDSSVGKSSFIKRAQSGKFSLDLPASVGIDSFMWTVVVDGKPVVLQLWDTAGQERFHSITRQIFHKAQAFLLMYDITSSQSFSAVSYWANCIQEGAAEDVTILLLGNKSDHAKRQIKFQEGEILAKEYNFEFMECSAATGENVIQSLETVARMLSKKVDPREETTVLHKEPQQKKSSGCC